ncbi:MAG: aldo/keto reductase [Roseateles asaccharophilus]|uniref:Aryl-alcohol dehydrogenase-like predicted oxidoreductase n=1 Tax=Roseateles asaccharophilus TaxID=582607 RepID=A0A4R6N940_9BURK|nr:aldo/keto reductase [Roseateles asaccharophilus]MDN3543972.1 aldo/keto reductase [Roseateles asaccharophilus]TDP11649.1 aryl-alcohol dehydrogenase-like predicted oxidoreductase [Roseateles asaccharophilus]
MESTRLGRSSLNVSRICLGTMTFGEQVDEAGSHAILDHAVARGLNFIDTAEMYPVPARADSFAETERLIGRWLKGRPGMRERLVIATKVSGPSRGYGWIRNGAQNLSAADIVAACEDSLRRLQIETIDLYQIHWPLRHVPMFGGLFYEPEKNREVSAIAVQLEALDRLVRAGKVREIGLSNETAYGVCEFVHQAERLGLPRIVSVQNPYALVNRVLENGLDEAMHRHDVSLLAYSPLGFGSLTGKYDARGLDDPAKPGRLAIFEGMRKQRWARPETLAAARRYNALARAHGMSASRMALAWCYGRWQTASTIIGVTSIAQLDENLDAWGTRLAPELLAEIDRIRWEIRDPAQ